MTTAPPLRLYGPAFAADPHGHYDRLRLHGPMAPVEIAPGVEALLVTDYQAALDLLRDTHTFSKDPRDWQATAPAGTPVLTVLGYRPSAMFSDGPVHARYREAINDTLAMIEPHVLHAEVAEVAQRLLSRFAGAGTADLIESYARVLPLHVFRSWFGVSEPDMDRLAMRVGQMSTSTENAVAVYADLTDVVTRLVADRRARPRRDLTSYFLAHPAVLSDDETVRQITLSMVAGHQPTTNLIANALLAILSDPRYAGSVFGGAMTAHDAINEVLWRDPPLANLGAHYPRYDTEFHGVRLRRGQLLLVSYAAANSDAAPASGGDPAGSGTGAHLSWGAGPHGCPARQPALLIAITAVEQLTSQLCDMELAMPASELLWREGPFDRALAHLPVRFTALTGSTPAADTAAGRG